MEWIKINCPNVNCKKINGDIRYNEFNALPDCLFCKGSGQIKVRKKPYDKHVAKMKRVHSL